MPAIVLLNPDEADVLVRPPRNIKEQQKRAYWNEYAEIYQMGKYELRYGN